MFTPKSNFSRSRATPKSSPNRRSSLLSMAEIGNSRSWASTSAHPRTSSLVPQASHILEETDHHVVEAFGTQLPVLVSEILYLSEKNSDVSVCLSPNGWAWLVHGRRLVVWRYKLAASGARSMVAACRELTLPPSDLAHNAKLVNIFAPNENQTPSCIAVSPEGIIRYWPSIAHEGSSVEVSADLQGQECYSLTDLQPLGSVLATTTSTVVLISCGGQHTISCRILKSSQGLLGGIGRRVSSLFWGSMTSGVNSEAKLVQVLGCPAMPSSGSEEHKNVYVLTANTLQKWLLVGGSEEEDKLFYDWDVDAMVREAFAKSIWGNDVANPSWLKIWFLDMALTDNGIAILCAALNPNTSQQLHFALGVLSTGTNAPPLNFRSFCVLKHTLQYDESSFQSSSLGYKFLLPMPQYLYMYNDKTISCTSAVADGEEPDVLDFSAGGNCILGVGIVENLPLFFTVSHGIITLTTTEMRNQNASAISDQSGNESSGVVSLLGGDKFGTKLSESLNLSVSQAGLENLTMSESKTDQLKAAFLFFCKRNTIQAAVIVEELFPSTEAQELGETDSALNRLVVSMSQDLIDDFPASDPRWMESVRAFSQTGTNREMQSGGGGSIGSSMSLLILHQLEDKQMALELYINFLKEVGLWTRLTGVHNVHDVPAMATARVLSEHDEKIVAALTLRSLNAEFPTIIDKAIRFALSGRKNIRSSSSGNLTPQDHFYREISKVEDIITGLQNVVKHSIFNDQPKDMVNTVMTHNKIVLAMIKEALLSRSRKKAEFEQSFTKLMEYLPWTSSPGPKGLRTALLHFYKVTLEQVIPLSEDTQVRAALYQQLVEYADIIFDEYKTQIETIPVATDGGERKDAVVRQYEKDRLNLIMPLVNNGYWEGATSLAEKYYEFSALVKLCELTNDRERLERYMDQFAEQNISNFVFDWHVREGKQGRLLAQSTGTRRQQELGRFLSGHAGLSWLHDIQTSKCMKASKTLKQLAQNEIELLSRKKTMLSLSKLTAFASDEPIEEVQEQVDFAENEMNVVLAQEQLPKSVLESFGFDPSLMYVLSPKELIELYIGDENTEGDHIDFKKALDLLEYVRDMNPGDKDSLRLHIWARSVLRDSWTDFDVANPLDAVRETVFFKLVEFCYLQGANLASLLFPCDQLLESQELSKLALDKNFEFLIRTAYEHLVRTCCCQA